MTERRHNAMADGLGRTRVVDLTHTLTPEFPLFPVYDPVEVASRFVVGRDGLFAQRWSLDEHAGTHVDAPAHFCEGGETVDRIAADRLVLRAAVIDIRERVRSDHDTCVTPDDVLKWEARFGPLPERCGILALTGWSDRIRVDGAYLNADSGGVLHIPGFGGEMTAFVHSERPQVCAIGIDAPSLDIGASSEFPAHVNWLTGGGYGIENLTGLEAMPASGAHVVIGVPRLEGGSGGPTRVLGLTPR